MSKIVHQKGLTAVCSSTGGMYSPTAPLMLFGGEKMKEKENEWYKSSLVKVIAYI